MQTKLESQNTIHYGRRQSLFVWRVGGFATQFFVSHDLIMYGGTL